MAICPTPFTALLLFHKALCKIDPLILLSFLVYYTIYKMSICNYTVNSLTYVYNNE